MWPRQGPLPESLHHPSYGRTSGFAREKSFFPRKTNTEHVAMRARAKQTRAGIVKCATCITVPWITFHFLSFTRLATSGFILQPRWHDKTQRSLEHGQVLKPILKSILTLASGNGETLLSMKQTHFYRNLLQLFYTKARWNLVIGCPGATKSGAGTVELKTGLGPFLRLAKRFWFWILKI